MHTVGSDRVNEIWTRNLYSACLLDASCVCVCVCVLRTLWRPNKLCPITSRSQALGLWFAARNHLRSDLGIDSRWIMFNFFHFSCPIGELLLIVPFFSGYGNNLSKAYPLFSQHTTSPVPSTMKDGRLFHLQNPCFFL